MAYLQKGEPASAGLYLKRALALGGRRTASEEATLFGGLAIVSYADRDYAQAAEYGKKALLVKTEQAAPFGFITGPRAPGAREAEGRAAIPGRSRGRRQGLDVHGDYRAYARVLKRAKAATSISSRCWIGSSPPAPTSPASGLMQSAAYERLGDFDGAVLSAFKEAAGTARHTVLPDHRDIQSNLAALGRKLDDKSFNPDRKGKDALDAVRPSRVRTGLIASRLLDRERRRRPFEKYLLSPPVSSGSGYCR